MPVMLRALALTAALAAGHHPTAHRVPALPRTDGRSSAAWVQGTTLHVLRDDQALGAEATGPVPPGCTPGGVDRGRVGFLCRREGAFVLEMGSTTGLDPATAVSMAADDGSASYVLQGVGDALFELLGTEIHGDFSVFVRRDSGRGVEPHLTATRVSSLDHATGVRHVCAPIRIGTHLEDDELGPAQTWDDADIRPPWVLTAHRGHALLRHCGSRRVRVLGRSHGPIALTRRYAAWAEPGRVTVRMLATGRTLHFAPYLSFDTDAGDPQLRATDHRLWLGDSRGNAYIIEL